MEAAKTRGCAKTTRPAIKRNECEERERDEAFEAEMIKENDATATMNHPGARECFLEFVECDNRPGCYFGVADIMGYVERQANPTTGLDNNGAISIMDSIVVRCIVTDSPVKYFFPKGCHVSVKSGDRVDGYDGKYVAGDEVICEIVAPGYYPTFDL